MSQRCFTSVLSCMLLLLIAGQALGIIEGVENDDLFHDPQSDWYGVNWDYVYQTGVGSSVAVGYFALLTARHCSIGIGNTFTINGNEFEVVGKHDLPVDPGQSLPPDLRVVELKNNTRSTRPLPGFYQLYTGPFDASNTDTVIVGTGFSGEVYSHYYREDSSTGRTKRWGTNEYSDSDTPTVASFATSCFRMGFRRSDTAHESGYSNGDSGGGAFLKPDGEDDWKLAGINLYRAGSQGWYQDIYAAKIPDYADWLHDLLSTDLLPGDVDLDGDVDYWDYSAMRGSFGVASGAEWSDGDSDLDGDVDYWDYSTLRGNFGYTSAGHPIMTPPPVPAAAEIIAVPEPCAVVMLAGGLLGLALLVWLRPHVADSPNCRNS